MSEKPLNEYIDLEAYDVVTGEQYRALKEQLETLRVVLETAYHYYPKDTPMSDSMKNALGESNPASEPKEGTNASAA